MQVFALEIESRNVRTRILFTTDAGAPQIIDNYILLTFQSNERTAFVAAAFDFENYARIHQFRRNADGIYFLAIRIPEREVIHYRLIVDGIWMADPFNPARIRKPNFVEVSVLNLADIRPRIRSYPVTEGGITHFRFRGQEGESVFLAGSFNRWDPFMHHMEERRPGEFFISLRLPPGTHHYYFVVNGRPMPDEGNPIVVWDRDFRRISSFTVR
ncbi:MAG: hypothetical protein FWC36_08130 [Spirochaetes bacterium]|nr:hypothetical protein [Spirochaetota bacterium]